MSTTESARKVSYVSVGLAVFSMLFGAGNLIYPIKVGLESGTSNFWGLLGFITTAVILPLIGIIAMILFDGDYKSFFYRLGRYPGSFIIFACMLIIGPVIALPRIVTLSHTLINPFIPEIAPFWFAVIFLGVTFLFTFRESKIIKVLGDFISPILLLTLAVIILKGIFTAQIPTVPMFSNLDLFLNNLKRGYETLDLLGAIFFSSIILSILKSGMGDVLDAKGLKKLAAFGFKAGLIGVSLLALIYIGMSFLGMYHAQEFALINEGELFREVSFKVLGTYGAALICIAVIFACLSTSIALFAVVGEYLQKEVFKNKINFVTALIMLTVLTLPLSSYGLGHVLRLTAGPITYIGYPVIVAITFFNIFYKLFGFKYIKLPVVAVGLITFVKYFWF